MVQDDNERLKAGYKKLILSIMFITFVIMLGMAAVARPMIITLIGTKWLPSVEYLQLLCIGAMLFPLHALNLNILNVKGRSDLFLKLEVIKKATGCSGHFSRSIHGHQGDADRDDHSLIRCIFH